MSVPAFGGVADDSLVIRLLVMRLLVIRLSLIPADDLRNRLGHLGQVTAVMRHGA
jgi:hypothetical protein